MLTVKWYALAVAAPFALAVSFTQPAFSADEKGATKSEAQKGQNVDRAKKGTSPQADAVEMGTVADHLVQYGDKNKDALAMITAARLLKQIGVRDEQRTKKSEGKPTEGADKQAAAQPRDHSINGILTRAREYAGGRKDLLALADEAGKEGSRGAASGPIRHIDRVEPGRSDVYTVTFRGGEPAIVAISGDGDTDLDLMVLDQNGNRICVSNGAGDDEACRWLPRWTGPFVIRVQNLGRVYNQYRMWSN